MDHIGLQLCFCVEMKTNVVQRCEKDLEVKVVHFEITIGLLNSHNYCSKIYEFSTEIFNCSLWLRYSFPTVKVASVSFPGACRRSPAVR